MCEYIYCYILLCDGQIEVVCTGALEMAVLPIEWDRRTQERACLYHYSGKMQFREGYV
jgi:hypothetical protein